MKKWWWLLLLIPFIVIWQSVNIYQSTLADEKVLHKQAEARAKKIVKGIKVNKVEHFHGKDSYQVVHAINEDGEAVYVWVPDNNKKKPVIKKASEGWTEERVKEQVISERNPIEIIDIRLGMMSGTPLWEVKYVDNNDQYTYYYMNFQNGELVKRYSIKEKKT
ncbi:DUF5590 domain-containing protein [Bacillus solimangrovi]|uniref:Cell wall elongation regulator TseB-like domain-containing protein n=1 Tax=Bacillus solimangrovi TaxID=1305675 RepID=A0A1E5LH64_9BACI|nr:DUF5590 domain-containing protein [Bacillus solimangrovi]OEH93418.1 hypothetical protein BFG57_00030 [Bacillus solimangrovi]